MINHLFLGHVYQDIAGFIHLVKVLQNGEKICAGVIVSPKHILTPRICASELGTGYTVESGAQHISLLKTHNVENILYQEELALLVIAPVINFKSPSKNRQIRLSDGHPSPVLATIIAWEPTSTNNTAGQQRIITHVPIVNLLTCANYYRIHNREITADNICTVQLSEENHCTREDVGSAFVLDDVLVGVLVYSGSVTHPSSPDIFISVNGNEYHRWIMSHIRLYLNNQVNTQHDHKRSG